MKPIFSFLFALVLLTGCSRKPSGAYLCVEDPRFRVEVLDSKKIRTNILSDSPDFVSKEYAYEYLREDRSIKIDGSVKFLYVADEDVFHHKPYTFKKTQ